MFFSKSKRIHIAMNSSNAAGSRVVQVYEGLILNGVDGGSNEKPREVDEQEKMVVVERVRNTII